MSFLQVKVKVRVNPNGTFSVCSATMYEVQTVEIKEKEEKMLGAAYDLSVGGLWLDDIIREHFRQDFKQRFGIDAKEAPRSWLRLLDESEKVKKQMSANQTPIPLNIECFMNDKDVSGKMQRAEFEEVAKPIFDKLRVLLKSLLAKTKLDAGKIDEVEIVGGSSRIPMIKQIVKEMFGKDPKTTMNQDEAVVRDEKPKTTTKTVAIELPIVETLPTTVDTEKFTKAEEEMQRADLMEKKKADAKNAVEEYVYEMRDKLCDQLGEYITEADADNLKAQLQSTEDWLYDEGEDCETAVYEQRLASLRALGDPVVERYREAGQRMGAFDRLDTTILRARKACDDFAANGPAHAHIDAKDMEKVLNAVEEKKRWVDEARHKQETRPKTDAPAVFVHEVIGQITQFENVVSPILNRPKPKVEPPKAPETMKTENPEGAADAPAGSQEQAEMETD